MGIRSVTLENFRRFKNLDLSFSQDFIILVGGNASGKTTVLESLHYASLLRAFPPSRAWELISWGENHFRVLVSGLSRKLEYRYVRKGERSYLRSQLADGVRKNGSEILGALPSVSFLPSDLDLLQSSPSVRRQHLDEVLFQTDPEYQPALVNLERVLAQRNGLLVSIKSGKAHSEELDFWDDQVAAFSVQLSEKRQALILFLNLALPNYYRRITGENLDFILRYYSFGMQHSRILELLQKNRNKDVQTGRTSVGAHRDDWRVEQETLGNLAHFLSRGEQRGIIIALKLLEAQHIAASLKKSPVLLFDETLAELDQSRKKRLLENFPTHDQVFFTTADLEEIPAVLRRNSQVIELG